MRTFLPAAVALLAGCAGGVPTGTVVGTVTLDGTPLPQGSVLFAPLDGQTPTAGAVVRDGAFTAKVPVAAMRVEVSMRVPTAKAPKPAADDMADTGDMREVVPARYNRNSELRLDVRPGDNPVAYELTTKK